MHSATLVHDDILDGDWLRRGIPTANSRFSTNNALLTGDAMLSLALSLIVDYDKRIIKVFSETGLQLAEGEYMDVNPSDLSSEEEYFKRISKKSASLFKASANAVLSAQTLLHWKLRHWKKFGQNVVSLTKFETM